MSSPKPIVVMCHGILARTKYPGWYERLSQHLWRETDFATIFRTYHAGPFPLWNVFLKNHLLAKQLCDVLEPYAQDGAELNFVCHSNGADVAVKAMRRLWRLGHRVNTAIFVAGAISCDIGRSGLYRLWADGAVKRFFSYSATDDVVLRFPVIWPNGYLGRLGFQFGGFEDWRHLHRAANRETQPGSGFFQRWGTGGHTGWWEPQREAQTFAQIVSDLRP